jgi:hypothetical protein
MPDRPREPVGRAAGRLSAVLAKLLYKPFGIVLGLVAARVAGKAFNDGWERTQGTKPPKALTEEATMGQVLGSAVARASVFAATAAIVDRAGAKAFRHVTGHWPGEQRPEPAKRLEPPTG